MSLEDKIETLTAVLNRNSDLLEGITAAAKNNMKTVEAAKPVAEKAEDGEKPTRGRKPAAEKAVKAPTVKEVTEKTQEFLKVDSDDEYENRRNFVKKIVAKFGAPKMSELEEGDRKAALDYLVAYAAGDETDLDEDEDEKPARRRDDDV